jgi:hypothetical protein
MMNYVSVLVERGRDGWRRPWPLWPPRHADRSKRIRARSCFSFCRRRWPPHCRPRDLDRIVERHQRSRRRQRRRGRGDAPRRRELLPSSAAAVSRASEAFWHLGRHSPNL